MHLWIVRLQETLPTPDGRGRLMRAGQLALAAAERGWRVTWWISRFDHYARDWHRPENIAATRARGIELELLHTPPYQHPVSAGRFLHDFAGALDFVRRAGRHPAPDVVLVSLPPIELAAAAVSLARSRGVPVVVDVRDIWPDVWTEVVPPALAPVLRLLQPPYRHLAARALRRADALFACGSGALAWALRLAGRDARPADAVFPHAVRVVEPDDRARSEAAAFLDAAGVTEARSEGDRLRLVFAGNLTPRSGCLAFLERFRALPEDVRRGIRVLVAGGGVLEADIRAVAAQDRAVTFLGWLDRVQLRLLYERSDVGLLPYVTFESGWIFVNKFGDYLAHGLPVLTTVGNDTGRFVNEYRCGLVWNPERPDELAGLLLELRDVAGRLEELRGAARRIGALFRAERVYGAMLDRLHALARRRADGGRAVVETREPGGFYASIPTQGAS